MASIHYTPRRAVRATLPKTEPAGSLLVVGLGTEMEGLTSVLGVGPFCVPGLGDGHCYCRFRADYKWASAHLTKQRPHLADTPCNSPDSGQMRGIPLNSRPCGRMDGGVRDVPKMEVIEMT